MWADSWQIFFFLPQCPYTRCKTNFAVKALFALKGFIEAPDDNPITKAVSYGAVGALMILLPYIIGVMRNSMGAAKDAQDSASSSFQKDVVGTGDFQ